MSTGAAAPQPATITSARHSLRAKLIRVYALQVLLISVAALVGVYITYLIVQDVLTRQALAGEAEHFWSLYADNPTQGLPNTANMQGYLDAPGSSRPPPAALLKLAEGYGRVDELPGAPLAHISERDGERLYLLFAEGQVSSLVFYFGLAPLSAVLLTVYALLFLTYRLSHQAISPMMNLAQALERFDFRDGQPLEIPAELDNADRETRLMIEAFESFTERLANFLERERTFTRNAGHELRTPIAVMKGSLDILESRNDLASRDQTVLARMRRVVGDMEVLLETLLTLAREEDVFAPEGCSVNLIVAEEVELLTDLAQDKGLALTIENHAELSCNARPRVLGIIVSNLVRNAISYTEAGNVTVVIDAAGFSVRDSGIGIAEGDLEHIFTAFFRSSAVVSHSDGQGLGLALVKRLCNQLGWRLAVQSELGQGTEMTVTVLSA